jgi:hypothetical protein
MVLSTYQVATSLPSTDTSDLTAVSWALARWLRKTGIAIAARMPMMIMTTRSSIRVKPWSFSSARVRMRASIEGNSLGLKGRLSSRPKPLARGEL